MAVLIDSNVLLRSLHPGHAHYALAENAISTLRLRDETLCIAPQNLVEFWAVSTRPQNDNGLGLTVARLRLKWRAQKIVRPFAIHARCL